MGAWAVALRMRMVANEDRIESISFWGRVSRRAMASVVVCRAFGEVVTGDQGGEQACERCTERHAGEERQPVAVVGEVFSEAGSQQSPKSAAESGAKDGCVPGCHRAGERIESSFDIITFMNHPLV